MKYYTPGLEVVLLPNVDPVGGIVGGYWDLYILGFDGGLYYFGMIL